MDKSSNTDYFHELQSSLSGSNQVRNDVATRILFSTDASIYQILPIGVAFPRGVDDICAIVEISKKYKIPIIARGAGSGLAGQAIGPGLIVDCSRYMNKIHLIDPSEKLAILEPGVVLNLLNKQASKFNLQFGPDPASAERATIGGVIANNATGAHSIQFGMAADHILELEVVLEDASRGNLLPISLNDASRKASGSSREASIYSAALRIRESYQEIIKANWPRVWRNASGYNINYLIPWAPSFPPLWSGKVYPEYSLEKPINLAPLFAGSEGTLGIINRARVNLVTRPEYTILAIINYNSLEEACDAVPELLQYQPSAVELLPRSIVNQAKTIPSYAQQVPFLSEEPAAFLILEFSGCNLNQLISKARKLGKNIIVIESNTTQKYIWNVRKAGLGIIQSKISNSKPISFIEDLSVPVDQLGLFVRKINQIFTFYQTNCEIYAHASAGCLHIRPIINIRTNSGKNVMREIASEAVELVSSLGGSASGEHGDGLARSEWLTKIYGKEIVSAFKFIKKAADPNELMNPGKIVGLSVKTQPQEMDQNLRFNESYKTQDWVTNFQFNPETGGIAGAIEHCNGAGVCRKSEGVMCPSFQVSQEEMFSTRGRANLLRAMISGRFPSKLESEKSVYNALDLCLACKGCKSECPSSVDMSKLKYEFFYKFYITHSRKFRDYLFGYIHLFLRLGKPIQPVINWAFRNQVTKNIFDRYFSISKDRSFPTIAPKSFRQILPRKYFSLSLRDMQRTPVFLLIDAFHEYMYPNTGVNSVYLLEQCGFQVIVLPCCGAGRTLISKSFLPQAKHHAERLLDEIIKMDSEGRCAVVGIEPSEIYTIKDEYFDLLPHRSLDLKGLRERTWMIDEFLIRQDAFTEIVENHQMASINKLPKVLLHGHCYQKAQPPSIDGLPIGVNAAASILTKLGYEVEIIEAGCCGMAGAFGYEKEHFEFSNNVGEQTLFPIIRKSDTDTIVVASGVSCKAQIEDGTSRKVIHSVDLISQWLRKGQEHSQH